MKTHSFLLPLVALTAVAGLLSSCTYVPRAARPHIKAAEQNDADAQFKVALAYYKDPRGPRYTQAYTWFKKAADQGHADAMANMSVCTSRGEGTPKDIQASINWARKGVAAGNASCHAMLGALYADGYVTGKAEYDKALPYLIKAGDMGLASSYAFAAKVYEQKAYQHLPNVDQGSLTRADAYYIKAVGNGDTSVLGKGAIALAKHGHYEEAWSAAQKGIDAGDSQSLYAAGMFYLKGYGVEADTSSAIHYFNRAVSKQNADAEAQFAHMYATGEGVEANAYLVPYYYKRAIEHGLNGPALYTARQVVQKDGNN